MKPEKVNPERRLRGPVDPDSPRGILSAMARAEVAWARKRAVADACRATLAEHDKELAELDAVRKAAAMRVQELAARATGK